MHELMNKLLKIKKELNSLLIEVNNAHMEKIAGKIDWISLADQVPHNDSGPLLFKFEGGIYTGFYQGDTTFALDEFEPMKAGDVEYWAPLPKFYFNGKEVNRFNFKLEPDND